MLEQIKNDNHQVYIDNSYVSGDLVFFVILLGKEFSSPKWCFKYKLHPKVWLEYGHTICEDWTINTLRLDDNLIRLVLRDLVSKKHEFRNWSKLTNTFFLFFVIRLIWVTISYIMYLIMEMNTSKRFVMFP